jgi:two-component system alkaline phosphatase synthesis response regulator PhoP
MARVLIVEDDKAMAAALRDGFAYEGFEVQVARDGESGLRAALERSPDAIILDVMLPKLSGLDILKQLRHKGDSVPVILLTARGQEIDKVVGLRSGADDYVTKPFSFMELMARVEALLRRSGGFSEGIERYEFGDVSIDFSKKQAFKGGCEVELSPREFRLLQFFVQKRGQVLSREQLLDGVWGYESSTLTRTVDMHVAKLRKKVEDQPADPQYITTVHRMGYKFTG